MSDLRTTGLRCCGRPLPEDVAAGAAAAVGAALRLRARFELTRYIEQADHVAGVYNRSVSQFPGTGFGLIWIHTVFTL